MIHKHNFSADLGSKRGAIHYYPNGSGRDSYIHINNGGTSVPQLGNYMKFRNSRVSKIAPHTRFHNYSPDGSGRDKYIGTNHGGQYHLQHENSALLIKFRNSLRDSVWKIQTKSNQTEFDRNKRIKTENNLSRSQAISTVRLSEPRRTNKKYLQKIINIKKTYMKNLLY